MSAKAITAERACSTVSGMRAVERGREWLRVPTVDLLLAGGTAALATADTLNGDHNDGPVAIYLLTGLLQTLPLAWRRRSPLGVLGFVLVVTVVEALLVLPAEGAGVFFGIVIPVYTAAAHCPLRTSLLALAMPAPVLAFTEWRVSGNPFDDLEFGTALTAGFWIAGRVVWSRQRLVDQLGTQASKTVSDDAWAGGKSWSSWNLGYGNEVRYTAVTCQRWPSIEARMQA